MVKRMIDNYKRIRNGKPENVKWHYRNVNTKTKLDKAVEDEIRLGNAKNLLEENDKFWVKLLEDEDVRIPIWFLKFRFKHGVYKFREANNNHFPNNKERILISLKEGGTYYNTKELAKDTAIDYKNISRYIKELEKEREIVIRPMVNNQKAIYLTTVYDDYKEKGIIM